MLVFNFLILEIEESYLDLNNRHEQLKQEHKEITKVLETSNNSLERALITQQNKIKDSNETIENRHKLILDCNYQI